MKTLHLAIIIFSFVFILTLSQTVFGSQQNQTNGCIHYGPSRQCVPPYLVSSPSSPSLEDQLGNPTKTTLIHGDAILVVNQTTNKTSYKSGEEITIIPELINIGNKSVGIGYWEPPFFLEIKNVAGDIVWPQSPWIAYIPEFHGAKILKPGERFSARPWVAPTSHFPNGPSIRLSSPGNYTAISVATLTFNTGTTNIGSLEPIWSKPIQIIILPEQYMQNETNSSASKISSNQTSILSAEPIANQGCVDKIMAQEHAQDAPIDDIHALDLAKNYTQYKLKTLGHNYTLNRIYRDFSVDSSSCNAQIKDVIVEFVEKNSLGHSLITITEDLGGDRVKNLDISQINDEPVTHANAYMIPMEPQIDDNLILFIVLVIGVISVVAFFIFRIRKKR